MVKNSETRGKKRKKTERDSDKNKAAKIQDGAHSEVKGIVAVEFIKELNRLLSSQQTFIAGLTKLKDVLVSTKLEKIEVFKEFMRVSPQCSEVFKILETEKQDKSLLEIQLVFDVLEGILLLTAEDELEAYKSSGITIAHKLLQFHMKQIYSALNPSNPASLNKAVLRLLSAMVAQGSSIPLEILETLDFTIRSFQFLPNKRGKQVEGNVRSCFIFFAFSFLICGDEIVYKKVLELKGFLQTVIKGLKEDPPEIIHFVLSTLQSKVLENSAVSKKTKVLFLNTYTLTQLAGLYQYTGNDESVKGALHKFLQEACCTFKHGICFRNAEGGIASRSNNPVLLRFLTQLKDVTEDKLVQELVIKSLVCCPDMVQPYFNSLQLSFLPRLSAQWIRCMNFLIKVLESLPLPSDTLANLSGSVLSSEHVQSVVQLIFPVTKITRNVFTQGIQSSSSQIKYKVLEVIKIILTRAIDVMNTKQSNSIPNVDLHKLVTEAICKLLPDIQSVINLRQVIVGSSSLKDSTESVEGIADYKPVSHFDLLSNVLQVMHGYLKLWPSGFKTASFDLMKLLSWKHDDGTEIPDSIKHMTLKLVCDAPAGSLQCFKHTKKESEQSSFFKLLHVTLSSSDEDIQKDGKLLIIKLLEETGLFEGNLDEIKIWLKYLSKDTLTFVDKICHSSVKDPYSSLDQITEFVSKSLKIQCKDIKTSELVANFTSAWKRTPFSPLVITALEVFGKLTREDDNMENKFDEIFSYMNQVLMSILSQQVEPCVLCYTVIHYLKETSFKTVQNTYNIFQYACEWIGGEELCNTKIAVSVDELKEKNIHQILSILCLNVVQLRNAPEKRKKKCFSFLHHQELYSVLLAKVEQESDCHITIARHVLLCLSEALKTCLVENNQSCKHVVISCCQILNLLISKCSSTIQTAVSNTGAAVLGSENMGATDEMQTVSSPESQELPEESLKLCKVILQHPVIKQWFLSNVGSETLQNELLALMKENISQMLLLVSQKDTSGEYATIIKDYLEIILVSIRSDLRNLLDDGIILPVKLTLVRTFLPYFKLSDVISMRDSMTQALDEETTVISPDYLDLLLAVFQSLAVHVNVPQISQSCFSKLINLSQALSKEQLDGVILQLLTQQPEFSDHIQVSMLDFYLKSLSEIRVSIVKCLVYVSVVHRCHFEKFVLERDSGFKLRMEEFVPIVGGYLAGIQEFGIEGKMMSSCVQVLHEVYWLWLWKQICNESAVDDKDEKMKIFVSLLKHGKAGHTQLSNQFDKLLSLISEGCGRIHVTLAQVFISILSEGDEKLGVSLSSSLGWTCMKSLTDNKDAVSQEDRSFILHVITVSMKMIDGSDLDCGSMNVAQIWSNFLMSSLRHNFQCSETLEALKDLMKIFYGRNGKFKLAGDAHGTVSLDKVHSLILGHSHFLDIMMDKDSNTQDRKVKDSMVKLLCVMTELNPKCCQTEHFPVWLGAYSATLKDQNLLYLMKLYEDSNMDMIKYRPFKWGPSALQQYKISKDFGSSLWQQASSTEVIELLTPNLVRESAMKFPLNRKLEANAQEEMIKEESVYDPCFLLPLFNALLQPGCDIDCRKFVETGCLGYCVVSLASHDEDMRLVAYQVLYRFYTELEGARFREQPQVLHLMTCLKNGITEPAMHVSSVIGWFVYQALQILIRPGQQLYILVNSFLLQRASLDVHEIPMFYTLFNSSSMQFNQERLWMLKLLVNGFRDATDYYIFKKRHTFELVMSFYNSPMCENKAPDLVLELVEKICHVHPVVYDLTKNYGLISWIHSVVNLSNPSSGRVIWVIKVINILWQTLEHSKVVKKVLKDSDGVDEATDDAERLVIIPTNVPCEVMMILLDILHRRKLNKESLVLCLNLLCRTMKYAHNTKNIKPIQLSFINVQKLCQLWTTSFSQEHLLDQSLTSRGENETVNSFKDKSVENEQESKVMHEKTEKWDCLESIIDIITLWNPRKSQMVSEVQEQTHCTTGTVLTLVVNAILQEKHVPKNFNCLLKWFRIYLSTDIQLQRTVLSQYGVLLKKFVSLFYCPSSSTIHNKAEQLPESFLSSAKLCLLELTKIFSILKYCMDNVKADTQAPPSWLKQELDVALTGNVLEHVLKLFPSSSC